MVRFLISITVTIFLHTVSMASLVAQETHANSDKVIHAVRAQGEVTVDGLLDDDAWAYASAEGAEPGRDTFRIDDGADRLR